MHKKIINKIINLLGKIVGKKILLVPGNNKYIHAVKSNLGFWYCGNIYDTSDIAYGISLNGVVEKEETFVVQNILKELPSNFTLLDIGANTGYYGIMSSYQYPESKSYSFEPIKEHCELIYESAYLNRLSNIDINQYALGQETGNMDIYTAGSGTTLIKEFTQFTENKININIKKLDDVVKEKGISSINFIKIDVEGFEFEVLQGSQESLKLFKPTLFVEICHSKDGRNGLFINKNFNKTINFIENLGYKSQILLGEKLIDFDKKSVPPKGVWMFLFTSNT